MNGTVCLPKPLTVAMTSPEPILLFAGQGFEELDFTLLVSQSTDTDFALDLKPFCAITLSEVGIPDSVKGPFAETFSVEWLFGVSGFTATVIVGPAAAATPTTASIVTPNVAIPLRI